MSFFQLCILGQAKRFCRLLKVPSEKTVTSFCFPYARVREIFRFKGVRVLKRR